ncbi:MFS transporter [Paraburkholderia sp. JHI869]|uniref:MFS transporter n=1 Tax=Paraburkholderia sp. JHI869 TaxID=3112959 RepID=UPI00316F1AE7
MAIVNSGARLDRLPIGRFHWKILGLISAGAFLDAFDIYLANGALAAMVKTGFADLRVGSFFLSATFLGMMIGAGLSGYLGDRYGRRFSYQANLAIFGGASFIAAFAPNIYWLILLRFIMGVGLGAELVVAAGTLCEFVPPASRGRWTSLLALITNSGLLAATAVGYWVIPHLGWRYMFAIAGVGAIVVWALRHRMPESPRWLETVGRLEEAERTVAAIEQEVQRHNGGTLPPVTRVTAHETSAAPFSALFAPGMKGRTFVAALTAIAVNVSLYGFVAWLPAFFVNEGLSITRSLGFVFLMSFGAPAGAVVGFAIADRLGRRRALIASALVSIVLGYFYVQMRDPVAISVMGFALVTALYTVCTLGLFVYIPELFPTTHRLRGTGVAGTCGRAASMCTPYLAVLLYSHFGVSGVVAMVACVLVALCVALLFLRVEASGQTLEAVSAPVAQEESIKQPDSHHAF